MPDALLVQKIEAPIEWRNETGVDLVVQQQVKFENGKVSGIIFVIARREQRSDGGIIVPHA
jgi:hypothetical protein